MVLFHIIRIILTSTIIRLSGLTQMHFILVRISFRWREVFIIQEPMLLIRLQLLREVRQFLYLIVLLTGTAGPYAPRGVDNDDPDNTGPSAIGYFIGADALLLRQVNNAPCVRSRRVFADYVR